jgi:hypothetical protein
MLDKHRWLPCWQRVELVEKCLREGLTRRQAAASRRVSVSTVQYWIERAIAGPAIRTRRRVRGPEGSTVGPPSPAHSLLGAGA